MKLIFRCVLFVTLAALMTGCCTRALIDKSSETYIDVLKPSAVYRSANGHNFGLEGMRTSYDQPEVRAYLIIPQSTWVSNYLQTNGNITTNELKILPSALTKHLDRNSKLPSDYKKVADLPKNNLYLPIKTRHPNEGLIAFLPFAVAGDIILTPFDLAMLCLLMTSHGC